MKTPTNQAQVKITWMNEEKGAKPLVDMIQVADLQEGVITTSQIVKGLNELLGQESTTYDFNYIEKVEFYKEQELEIVWEEEVQ